MKPLQNNFTTPEQSKRLLELGVPADSADESYIKYIEDGGYNVWWERIAKEFDGVVSDTYYPCWSVGRLIEIYNICCYVQPTMEWDFGYPQEDITYMEMIITAFELAEEISDFSKLED